MICRAWVKVKVMVRVRVKIRARDCVIGNGHMSCLVLRFVETEGKGETSRSDFAANKQFGPLSACCVHPLTHSQSDARFVAVTVG